MAEPDLLLALAGMFIKFSLESNFQKCHKVFDRIPEGAEESFMTDVMFLLSELGELSRDLELEYDRFLSQLQVKKFRNDEDYI